MALGAFETPVLVLVLGGTRIAGLREIVEALWGNAEPNVIMKPVFLGFKKGKS
jgi:hypothetical protein